MGRPQPDQRRQDRRHRAARRVLLQPRRLLCDECGGHLDVRVLGAVQVSEHDGLANWNTGAPGAILHARLTATLNGDLEAHSGLSLQDFEVLARLTDDATGKLRIYRLALLLDWQRSRVSHQVRRMQRRGLVEGEECPEDNRGDFVVLTPTGREAIEQAAPGHVRTVRRIVFDALTAEELHTLDIINGKVLGRIDTGRTAEG